MVHSHAQTLRAGYAAFAQGDPGPLLGMLADDIVWHVSGRSPLAGTYRGRPEVLDFFAKMAELYEGRLDLEVRDVFADDRRGVVLTLERATYADKTVEYTAVHVWDIHQGKCTGFQSYNDDAYDAFWP